MHGVPRVAEGDVGRVVRGAQGIARGAAPSSPAAHAAPAAPTVSLPGGAQLMRLFLPSMLDAGSPRRTTEMLAALQTVLPEAAPDLAAALADATLSSEDKDALREFLAKALSPSLRERLREGARAAREAVAAEAEGAGPERARRKAALRALDVFREDHPVKDHAAQDPVLGWFAYHLADRRGRVRVRFDRAKRRGCFFELAVESDVLGALLFGLTVADGTLALDVWASPETAETVRAGLPGLLAGLRARGISVGAWRVDAFGDQAQGLDARV